MTGVSVMLSFSALLSFWLWLITWSIHCLIQNFTSKWMAFIFEQHEQVFSSHGSLCKAMPLWRVHVFIHWKLIYRVGFCSNGFSSWVVSGHPTLRQKRVWWNRIQNVLDRNFDWMTFTGYANIDSARSTRSNKSLMVLLYFYSIKSNVREMIGFCVHFRHCFSN